MKMFIMLLNCIKRFYNEKISTVKESKNNLIHYMKSYGEGKDLSNYSYEDLTPKDDIGKNGFYLDTLDWAISNNKILNIALTGTYGSGKSSILKSYQKRRRHLNYLNISLAAFHNLNDLELDVQTNDDIEKSILQQIFYKVSPSKLPYTRFKKIKNITFLKVMVKVAVVIFTVLLGLFLLKPEIITKLQENRAFLNTLYSNEVLILNGYILFFSLSLLLIFRFIYYLSAKLRLAKINFNKAEVELDKTDDMSILNKYLDEILYFFEVTKYSIVFIEDLDRFNNTRIFTKLRELNHLINNCEQIKRKVVFIYAIKDDMFKNEERTKFFDFIIPVIPVINSGNAGEILHKKIRQNEFGENISDEFINEVSVYIEDMRILTNIYNEFVLYKNILSDVTLRGQQILALIVYKNLYPNDFSELQFNRGIIFEAFVQKALFVKDMVIELKKKRVSLEEKLEKADQENLSSLRELKAAFLVNLASKTAQIQQIKFNNNYYTLEHILNDNFDFSDLNSENIHIMYYNQNINEYSSMSSANERAGAEFTYMERMENINNKSTIQQEQLKLQIEKLREEERTISAYSLKNLIKKYGSISVLEEKILQEKLIAYLLRSGYIDETYSNYLSYFYPNSLTAQDMNFILAIRNQQTFEFNYSLNKMENLVLKLNLYEFEQKEILNFGMVEFLLERIDDFRDRLSMIMEQLSDEKSISLQFIDEFKDITQYKSVFWQSLCEKWHNIWDYIQKKSNFSSGKMNIYLRNIIMYVNIENIISINHNNSLSNYISNCGDFLQVVEAVDSDKIKSVIFELDIKFSRIRTEGVAQEILDYIFEKSFYLINVKMIETIIANKAPEYKESLYKSNLTSIKSSGYLPVIEYININLSEYLTNVFLELETNTNEDIEVVIDLLNKLEEVVPESIKVDIINKENFKLNNITSAPEYLWEQLMSTHKAVVDWENVLTYFNKYKLDECLIKLLNTQEVYSNLSLSKFSSETDEGKEIDLSLSHELIKAPIDDISFDHLAESIPYVYNSLDIGALPENRVKILINKGILNFTVDNYNNLKQHFAPNHIMFIDKHKEKYINELEKYTVDEKDLLEILKTTSLSVENKLKIVNVNIINDDNLLRSIYKIVLESKNYELNIELFDKIWLITKLEDRLRLLVNQIKFMGPEKITACLNDLGGEYAYITLPNKRQKLEYSEVILELAKELKESGYISSYSEATRLQMFVPVKYIYFNTKRK